MSRLRVLIAVDEANLGGIAWLLKKKVDWNRLREYLASEDEGRELVECAVYVGLPPAMPEFAEKREKKVGFVEWLRHNGFLVVTKDGTPAEPGKYKANVDVLMAIDTLDLAREIKPDIVVAVTGDSDFAYLAEKLRRSGIRVEIASVDQVRSVQLKKAANSVIDLREVFNQFESMGGEGENNRVGTAGVLDDTYRV